MSRVYPASRTVMAGHGHQRPPRPKKNEADLKQMQSLQNDTGHIKMPPNAFMMWSRIHRNALQNEEQKKPYYEVDHKLEKMHQQRFPDYEYRPKKRNCRELASEQGAGQSSERQRSSSVPTYTSQVLPLTQPMLLHPRMYPHPILMPYTWGYYPYLSFYPYCPMTFCSMDQSHYSRPSFVSHRMQGASHYQEGWNPYHLSQQSGGFNLAPISRETVQQTHYPVHISQDHEPS